MARNPSIANKKKNLFENTNQKKEAPSTKEKYKAKLLRKQVNFKRE
jgi:hypothetical protein